jgi:hypothetical protein
MLSEVIIKAIGWFRCGQIFEGKYKKIQARYFSKSINFHYQKNKKHSFEKKHWL